jgi:hypothetical protein
VQIIIISALVRIQNEKARLTGKMVAPSINLYEDINSCWDSIISTVTGLGARHLTNHDAIPGELKRFVCFLKCPGWHWGPTILLFNGRRRFFRRGVNEVGA